MYVVWAVAVGACEQRAVEPVAQPPSPVVVPRPPTPSPVKPQTPTPPLELAMLQYKRVALPAEEECRPGQITYSLVNVKRAVVATSVQASSCQGACTAADKREARAMVANIERRVDSGESSAGELDYDHTGCNEIGAEHVRTDRVAGRDVALIADRYLGPHDSKQHAFQIALEVCGRIFVSDTFGAMPDHSHRYEKIEISAPDANTIVVRSKTDIASGELVRISMPACPAEPLVKITEILPYSTQ